MMIHTAEPSESTGAVPPADRHRRPDCSIGARGDPVQFGTGTQFGAYRQGWGSGGGQCGDGSSWGWGPGMLTAVPLGSEDAAPRSDRYGNPIGAAGKALI